MFNKKIFETVDEIEHFELIDGEPTGFIGVIAGPERARAMHLYREVEDGEMMRLGDAFDPTDEVADIAGEAGLLLQLTDRCDRHRLARFNSTAWQRPTALTRFSSPPDEQQPVL